MASVRISNDPLNRGNNVRGMQAHTEIVGIVAQHGQVHLVTSSDDNATSEMVTRNFIVASVWDTVFVRDGHYLKTIGTAADGVAAVVVFEEVKRS